MSSDTKYLSLARTAREEENTADAAKYYDMVKVEDPNNAEAKFFSSYYAYWNATKGESCSKFNSFCKVVPSAVKLLVQNGDFYDVKLLEDFYFSAKDMPVVAHNVQVELWQNAPDSEKSRYDKDKKYCGKIGTEMLYALGDAIESGVASNKEAMKVAVKAWKKGVELNQKWPYYGIDKGLVSKYAAKIQKYDSSYVVPKKAGCISFAKA